MNRIFCESSSDDGPSNRYKLHLLLDKSVWDTIPDEDKPFIHWWYGKEKKKIPTLFERISFFITKSNLNDILVPGSVFEKILLGNNRSQVTNRFQRLLIFLKSYPTRCKKNKHLPNIPKFFYKIPATYMTFEKIMPGSPETSPENGRSTNPCQHTGLVRVRTA